ncbi:MAG: Acyl-CoA dehydrogenase C-terminal domain-containing protein, partial [Thermoguttaceae bacterium]
DTMLEELKQDLIQGKQKIIEAIAFIKQQGGSYLDLAGRRLVDSAIAVMIGHLFLGQGEANDRKKRVARRFIREQMSVLEMNCRQIHAGDTSAIDEYELLAGPVPAVE